MTSVCPKPSFCLHWLLTVGWRGFPFTAAASLPPCWMTHRPLLTLSGICPTCLALSLLTRNTSGLWCKAGFGFHVLSTVFCATGDLTRGILPLSYRVIFEVICGIIHLHHLLPSCALTGPSPALSPGFISLSALSTVLTHLGGGRSSAVLSNVFIA